MKNSKSIISMFILLLVSSIGVNAQSREPYRSTDRQVGIILQRLERSTNRFRSSLNLALVQARIDQTRPQNDINSFEPALGTAIDQFRDRFTRRLAIADDAHNILQKALPVNGFMTRNRLNTPVQNDWASVRTDLSALANIYGLSWRWNAQVLPPIDSSRSVSSRQTVRNNRLTGTFKLDPSRSDNPRDKAGQATRNVSENERQDVYDKIIARLESPEILAIERRGPTVTIASSLAPQTTVEADAREREEKVGNGRSTRVTATLRGEQLVISSNGYKENDFNVTFDATQNDRSLRVRRQIYSDQLTQPVVVDSVYDRTSDAAQWTIYQNADPVLHSTDRDTGGFIVRAGETVVAVLNNDLSTKQTKQGDAFTMTVRGPTQYEGAVIEGRVGSVNASGRLTGRSAMSLNFETIRLRNGQTYKFGGILGSVRKLNGDEVMVDNEGSAKGDNQTSQTIERTAIGTAVGAIIGAIAAGGKGAVIGAVVGASGGVGSVYVQGKDNLELPSGTELTIQASAPR